MPAFPTLPSSVATQSRSMLKAPAARAARKSRKPKAAVTWAPAAASSSARYCSGAQPMPPPTSSALVTPSVGNALPSGPATSTASPTSSCVSRSLPLAARLDEQADPVAVRGEQRDGTAEQEPAPGHGDHDELPGGRAPRDARRDELDGGEGAEVPHAGDPAVGRLRPLRVVAVGLCVSAAHAHSTVACRSCRQCTCTRGRLAASIADTAAEAPASVVMDATPLRSAVVRIS